MVGYDRLRNETILQAVKDYRSYKKVLTKNPDNELVQAELQKCEKFFCQIGLKCYPMLMAHLYLKN